MMNKILEITPDQKSIIGEEMRAHTAPFIASLDLVLSDHWVEQGDIPSARAGATASYVELRGVPYILTNDHVARKRLQFSLAHALRDATDPDGNAFRVINPFLSVPFPTDTAISRIDHEVWAQAQRRAISPTRIARRHDAVRGERLFLHGFPGALKRPSSFVGGMHATSVPYLTEERDMPPELDSRFFFALDYSPERARETTGRSFVLPVPGGFSGSLVWDTRYVRMRGNAWSAEQSVVTGLACAWPKHEFADRLLAVRIEVVREALVQALRLEAAYFRSLQREIVGGDQLTDWFWAEKAIVDIA